MSLASGSIDLNSLKVAGEGASKYITSIDNGGIKVHDAEDLNNFVQITSNGMDIYKLSDEGSSGGSKIVASFRETILLGELEKSYLELAASSITGFGNGKQFFCFKDSNVSETVKTSASERLDSGETIYYNNPVVINYEIPNQYLNTMYRIRVEGVVRTIDTMRKSIQKLRMATTAGTPDVDTGNYTIYSTAYEYTFKIEYDGNNQIQVTYTAYNSLSNAKLCLDYITISIDFTQTALTPTYSFGTGEATGPYSLAEGKGTIASGYYSHTEGYESVANNKSAHAEGHNTHASGLASHTEGIDTHANGDYSHAEGNNTYANGDFSHVEGATTYANKSGSHAEGTGTYADGIDSHAEGTLTSAYGRGSHAQGYRTEAHGPYSCTLGTYNKHDDAAFELSTDTTISSDTIYFTKNGYGAYSQVNSPSGNPVSKGYYELASFNSIQKAFIIGSGTDSSTRSNALTVDWDGNIEAAGRTSHWCYVNSVTSITITADRVDKNIPITDIFSSSDSSVFERAADSNSKYGVQINIPGTYMVSVSVGCNAATSGDLMGVTVFKNGTASLGPTYTRMGGNYDRIHLLPTPITIAAGDILTLYGRNNTDGRGTFDTCRLMIRKL